MSGVESPAPVTTDPVLSALQHATRAAPAARKLLVCPTLNWGREWLRTLAVAEGAWVGWEPMTARALAGELAMVPLRRAGLRVASDAALGVVVGSAIDSARAAGHLRGPLRELALSGGTRRAILDAVLELRIAGVTPDDLNHLDEGPAVTGLSAVLARYLDGLDARRLADPARVFGLALAHFEVEAPHVVPERIFLAPGLAPRGLPALLVERLRARGAVPLDPAPATDLAGLPPFALRCFRAATPSDEVREALRLAATHGWPDDQVELATPDPDTYGLALDALCRSTQARATMLHGIPLMRTRVGRALERWLCWLEEDLPADRIREALEAGDLRPPDAMADVGALARELRGLEIGWGRSRWEAALARVNDPAWPSRYLRRHAAPDAAPAERDRLRRVGEDMAAALRELLGQVLAHAPRVTARGATEPARTTIQRLAAHAHAWLSLVPVDGPAEERTLLRLRTRLDELASEPDGEVSLVAAIGGLRDAVADLRAWTDTAPERQPWATAGGHLHLTDLAHAGASGRPHLFLLGMDADRLAGAATPSALLPDGTRRALGEDRLATSERRRAERAAQVAAALALAAGRGQGASCTLSWSIAGDLRGRRAAPAPAVLAAMRAGHANPAMDFRELDRLAGPPACAVPDPARDPVDARDVWLKAMLEEDRLLDATALVRQRWPALLDAAPRLGARLAESAGAVELPVFSATSLELLSRCPLAWFYRYPLGLQPPAEGDDDPARWLDALGRGALLHRIFERAGRQFRMRQEELEAATVRSEVLEIVQVAAREWREQQPVPSEAVYEAEVDELRQAALAWLEMERASARQRHAPRWIAFEEWYEGPGITFPLADGRRLAIKALVDRIDAAPDGRLRVVDYKTGSPGFYGPDPKQGPLRGGRHLQPAVYAAAVAAHHRRPLAAFAYHFPTARGLGAVIEHDTAALQAAEPVVAGLMEHLAQGAYVPTVDADDCRHCDFQAICRVRPDPFGGAPASPRAEAAAAAAEAGDPAFAAMRARRARTAP